MQHFITSGLVGFEAMLGEGAYAFGNGVTMADICLVPQVYNALRWRVDMEQFPKALLINAKLNKLKAFQNAHPDRSPQT